VPILALTGTLLLHGLALQSLLLGFGSHKPPPPEIQGLGAMRVDAVTAAAEELVLVTVADIPKNDPDLAEQIASLGPQLERLPISILSSETLRDVGVEAEDQTLDDSVQAAPKAGDPEMRALMFGRYTSQISARVERTWRRPLSPVTGPTLASWGYGTTVSADENETFTCRVQIHQDGRGNVQEVLLLKCNGTEAWRHSLVIAIDQASPLPAPPTPAVFTQVLTMTFEGQAYQPGSSLDQYEIEHREEAGNRVDVRSPAY
jgi:hypothetical protein